MLTAGLAIASLWLAAVAAQTETTRPEVVASGKTTRIFTSSGTAAGWALPTIVDLGGEFSDLYPAISRDGRRLVFSSYRPVPGHYHSWVEFGLDDALYFRRTTPDWSRNTTMRAHAAAGVRYVANSGMLVATGGRRFLIDAPIREGIAPYATSAAAERSLLEAARDPYAGVDAILITHWHEDHFSPEAVAAHLTNSPRTILVSSPEVVDRVRAVAPNLPASRLRGVLPMPGRSQPIDVGGLTVHVLRIRHNPARRLPEQHLGFLIGGGSSVLHVGDADPKADNFALLQTLPQVDLALLPFWYVSDADNRRMVADTIRPRRVVAMHVPPSDVAKVEATLRDAGVVAALASSPGSAIDLPR